jgi:general nucleoside transport system permease protein
MPRFNLPWSKLALQAGAVLLALLITMGILTLTGAPPLEAFKHILTGSLGSQKNFSNVLVAWVPLVLVSCGLLITFSAGLWNIGVEGQITLGAIFTTWALRLLQDSSLPPATILSLSLLAGMLGGALWAGLAGLLRTFGGVNEIFGGLGLNFVATSLTIWLIFGPWKRPGIGSMSGTQPFADALRLPMFVDSRLSPWSLLLAFLAILLVFLLLRGTYFGLKLKAVGMNRRAAALMGVPTWQYLMLSFLLCGALGGLAGWVQVAGVYHRLIPAISSGYGFMGLLVAMLVNYQIILAALVSLFFAAINIGSIQLPILLKLDSSLSGVLQGMLVLVVLLADGVRQRLAGKSARGAQ